jgi:hypothetical protein
MWQNSLVRIFLFFCDAWCGLFSGSDAGRSRSTCVCHSMAFLDVPTRHDTRPCFRWYDVVTCDTHQIPIGIERWTGPSGEVRPAMVGSSPSRPSVPERVQVVLNSARAGFFLEESYIVIE